MTSVEISPASVLDASASVVERIYDARMIQVPFNTDQELYRLEHAGFLLKPLFFPKQTERVSKWEKLPLTLDLSCLRFEVKENLECCYWCDYNDNRKIIGSGCSCNPDVCYSCIIQNINSNANNTGGFIKNYRSCPTCRSDNPRFLPKVDFKVEKRPIQITIEPITERKINEYEKEYRYLSNMRSFYNYYSSAIGLKKFEDLTNDYERYCYNLFQILYCDINNEGEDEDEFLKTLFICDTDNNDHLIRPTSRDDWDTHRDGAIIYRRAGRYSRISIMILDDNEIIDSLYERLCESPTYYPINFVFDYCLQPAIREAFGGVGDETFERIWENENNDLLCAMMLQNNNELREILKDRFLERYDNDTISEVLGYNGYRSIRYIYINGDEQPDHENLHALYDDETEIA
jgi:hypothetical protein